MQHALAPLPRVAIIDCYDSYTNNLLTLFAGYSDDELLRNVVVLRKDQFSWAAFRSDVLPHLDCIVLSPGPGRSDRSEDFGFCAELLREVTIPVLGVCLGHQGIATAFGGLIGHVEKIEHGQRCAISHAETGLFAGLPQEVQMVTYNSLIVESTDLPACLEVTAWIQGRPDIIMGLSHRTKEIHGVQFHPESIHSSYGMILLQNFLSRVSLAGPSPDRRPSLPAALLDVSSIHSVPRPSPSPSLKRWKLLQKRLNLEGGLPDVRLAFESLVRKNPMGEIWLDSSKTPKTGTAFSYLASPSHLLSYDLGPPARLHLRTSPTSSLDLPTTTSFFDQLDALHLSIQAQTILPLPAERVTTADWNAGWLGWFGYEMKEESLPGYTRPSGVENRGRPGALPDACFAFTDRVLAYEHESQSWIAISLVEVDVASPKATSGPEGSLEGQLSSAGVRFGISEEDWLAWISSVESTLFALSKTAAPPPASPPVITPFRPDDSGEAYMTKIDRARHQIHEGESYELTLTTQFRSSLLADEPSSTPRLRSEALYDLYLRLRATNPAPYSNFISFPSISDGLAIISSSPERFIKIGRGGEVEMKPIKGTVGRCLTDAVEDARRKEVLQNDRKEIAENLMIVDLIRADLLSFCRPSTVTVPKLIQVETYDHVHTLVTTVAGQLADGVGTVEAIGRCFPPGSMTGAPKLRSVQILDELEDHRPRHIYSGALGYLSLDGAADFSVVIRTIVAQGDQLAIGAGGAITWLSDRAEELDETLVKLGSVTKGLFLPA